MFCRLSCLENQDLSYYAAIEVIVSKSATYKLLGVSRSPYLRGIANGYLYYSSFTPAEPLRNLVAVSEHSYSAPNFTIMNILSDYHRYILVATTSPRSPFGGFLVTVSGPGYVSLTSISKSVN